MWCIRKSDKLSFSVFEIEKKSPNETWSWKSSSGWLLKSSPFDVRSLFQSVKLRSVKSFQSNGKIVRDGSISGETSDAINHRGRPATRDCWRSAVVEVAPRKALIMALRSCRRSVAGLSLPIFPRLRPGHVGIMTRSLIVRVVLESLWSESKNDSISIA